MGAKQIASSANFSSLHTRALSVQLPNHNHQNTQQSFINFNRRVVTCKFVTPSFRLACSRNKKFRHIVVSTSGKDGGFSGGTGRGGGGSGGGGGGGGDEDQDRDEDDDAASHNRSEALLVLAEIGRLLDSLPKDLSTAIKAGRIPGSIVRRYLDLEKSPFMRWLLKLGGFKERLLADDLFLVKVGIECGVGIFTKKWLDVEWESDWVIDDEECNNLSRVFHLGNGVLCLARYEGSMVKADYFKVVKDDSSIVVTPGPFYKFNVSTRGPDPSFFTMKMDN